MSTFTYSFISKNWSYIQKVIFFTVECTVILQIFAQGQEVVYLLLCNCPLQRMFLCLYSWKNILVHYLYRLWILLSILRMFCCQLQRERYDCRFQTSFIKSTGMWSFRTWSYMVNFLNFNIVLVMNNLLMSSL